ncbi:HvfC family RiPP maturation protein [Pseudoalteromonas sp. NJ631]|uniref:HvfC family RiPP maturation protein n=1 Tax=Pseudoalteromonas sp. NJ631 TaxID=493915 RepID=UPI0002E2E6BC|nr:putative DNA-binding domain-containing protein [Pseudoalteromonas sp. NJ631]
MSFVETQQQFMAHIRDPDNHPAPEGIEARRLRIYQELFFNNVEGFVSSAFPVLKSLYTNEDWLTLIRLFFAKHDCHSPYFLEISKEFLQFLQTEYEPTEVDPEFLLELAHYEWLELDVATTVEAEHELSIEVQAPADAEISLASTARVAHYQYPVHQISETFRPTKTVGQTFSFALYRDEEDDVQFVALNPMTALMLSVIEANDGMQLTDIVDVIAQQVPQFTIEQMQQGAQHTLAEFADLGIIKTKNL